MASQRCSLGRPLTHLSSYWVIHPLGSGRVSGFVRLIVVLLVSFGSRGAVVGVVGQGFQSLVALRHFVSNRFDTCTASARDPHALP